MLLNPDFEQLTAFEHQTFMTLLSSAVALRILHSFQLTGILETLPISNEQWHISD